MEYLVYTDESGLTPDEKYMLIGALFVPVNIHANLKNELMHIFAKAKGQARKARNNFLIKRIQANDLSTIQSLLREDKNAFEMKYTNINNINYKFYTDFVDIVMRYPVSFSCLVIDKTNGASQFSPWDLFVNRYALLLETSINRRFQNNDGFTFICDEVSTPSAELLHFEDSLIKKVANRLSKHAFSSTDGNIRYLRSAITVSSQASLLSQASDLFLGAITGAMRQKQGLSIKKNKVEFSEYIKKSLGAKDFCVNVTKSKPIYFNVWHFTNKK